MRLQAVLLAAAAGALMLAAACGDDTSSSASPAGVPSPAGGADQATVTSGPTPTAAGQGASPDTQPAAALGADALPRLVLRDEAVGRFFAPATASKYRTETELSAVFDGDRAQFVSANRGSVLLTGWTPPSPCDLCVLHQTEVVFPGAPEAMALFELLKRWVSGEMVGLVEATPAEFAVREGGQPFWSAGWCGAGRPQDLAPAAYCIGVHRNVVVQVGATAKNDDPPSALVPKLEPMMAEVRALAAALR